MTGRGRLTLSVGAAALALAAPLLIGGFEGSREGRANAGVAWVLSGMAP
jgi:hypothetical protein